MDADVTSSTALRAYADLGSDLGDLKRIHDARTTLSVAERSFRRAWARLVSGESAADVAMSETADALAATRLGAIDLAALCDAEVGDPREVLRRSLGAAGTALEPALAVRLHDGIGITSTAAAVPDFVDALIRQPRAGATCPGRPRLILAPPESHADHCFVVATLGVALSDMYAADPVRVFVAGLAHHLHNATLPDSGFAGEIMLGDELGPLIQRLFDRELATLSEDLSRVVRQSLNMIGDADTPEGRAFHAADVLDRVLQMRQYERVARFTTSQALDDLQLVHAGPVQSFHRAVLAEAGLW